MLLNKSLLLARFKTQTPWFNSLLVQETSGSPLSQPLHSQSLTIKSVIYISPHKFP